jgi:hypothetical protein
MTFLEMIPLLKQCKKATRPGLGGYLVLANGINQSIPISSESDIQEETHFVIIFDEMDMIEPFVPWLVDIETDDWTIVE